MSLYVSVIRYNANIVPQDIQDLISYPDLFLTKLCQQIFFKCFFFSVRICFWLAVLLMAWDQTTLQNVRPPVLVGRGFPVMPRQKNGWTTRIYRNTSEDPELLKKRTLSTCQGNWHGIANWEHFFTSPDRDDPPPPPHTHPHPFLSGHSNHTKVYSVWRAKTMPSSSITWRPQWVLVRSLESNPQPLASAL